MSLIRVGSNAKFADGWDAAFGKKKSKAATPAKAAKKKAAAPSPKKKAVKKKAKK